MHRLPTNDVWTKERWTVSDTLFSRNNWTGCGLASILRRGLGMKWILCLCHEQITVSQNEFVGAFCTGKRHLLMLPCPLESRGNHQFSSSSSWILCSQQVRPLILRKVIIDSICPLVMTFQFWKHTLLLHHLHRSLEMISVTSWCVLSLEGAMLKLCSSWGKDFLMVPPASQAAEWIRAVKNLWI